MNANENYIKIYGTVKAVVYQNEENGYTVIKLDTNDGDTVTAVGCFPNVTIGEDLELTGEYINHSSYGKQFKTEFSERHMPKSTDGIFQYLASKTIKGIGPATATLIISEFGTKSLEIIENYPEKLATIHGISLKKAEEISESFKKQVGVRRLMEFLANFEIKPIYAIRLYKIYGDFSMDTVQNNPYVLVSEGVGASFAEADNFALQIGFEEDCAERIGAAVIFELKHNARNGHTFIPKTKLIRATMELISVDAIAVEEALEILIDTGELVNSSVANCDAYYLNEYFMAEDYCATKIGDMAKDEVKENKNLEKYLDEIQKEMSVEFAPLQLHSLSIAANNRIMVLTGGPGTGKTTTVRGIVSLFDKMKLKTLLAAPTGRAAKRMSELSNMEAATIHRLLEAGYSTESDQLIFRRDEDEPLVCDAVILDECSMVDILLMEALLRALPKKCRLVLVGDADQLPSVGAGFVFNDIIRSAKVETVVLTEIFRQTSQSRIVANAHKIIKGDYPNLNSNTQDSDFFFLRRNRTNLALETVVDLVSQRLPKKMGIDIRDIQVLSPTRIGEVGTKNLNAALQKVINPEKNFKKEKKFGEIIFREGDRVMQIRNNYDIIATKVNILPKNEELKDEDYYIPDFEIPEKPQQSLGVFNGDIGTIVAIDNNEEVLSVLFDERLVNYGFDSLSELEHAFAMTVHKSQGSEYGAVVLITLDGPPMLLCRSVLYTAITRAKNLLVCVGGENCFVNMIDNHKVTRRYSGLRARLVEK